MKDYKQEEGDYFTPQSKEEFDRIYDRLIELGYRVDKDLLFDYSDEAPTYITCLFGSFVTIVGEFMMYKGRYLNIDDIPKADNSVKLLKSKIYLDNTYENKGKEVIETLEEYLEFTIKNRDERYQQGVEDSLKIIKEIIKK